MYIARIHAWYLILFAIFFGGISGCGEVDKERGIKDYSLVVSPDGLVLNEQSRVFNISRGVEDDYKVEDIWGDGRSITVEIQPVSGDADLYIGWDTSLSRTSYKCSSEHGTGQLDSCTVAVPNDSAYHTLYIKVYGYSTARAWLRALSVPNGIGVDVNGASINYDVPGDGSWYSVPVTIPSSVRRVAVYATLTSGTDLQMWVNGCWSDRSGTELESCEFEGSGVEETYRVYLLSFSGATVKLEVDGTNQLFGFPINGETPSTTRINSVVDHQLVQWYRRDNKVVDPWGEIGEARYGASGGNCYKQASGTVFTANGNYTGAGAPLYLNYDGHPALDIRATTGTSVVSVCDGEVIFPASDYVNGSPANFNTIYIDCGGGWTVWILHSSWTVANHTSVSKGDLVSRVGNTGTVGPHLHIEFRRYGIPVDPYGWQGNYSDPLWIVPAVTLWE
jgi:hypothetical protein